MRKITLDDIKAVVEENPNQRNNFNVFECQYFIGSEPACVIGKIIHDVGGGPEDVIEEQNILGLADLFEVGALDLADKLQEKADQRLSWGEAYRAAEKILEARQKGIHDNRVLDTLTCGNS